MIQRGNITKGYQEHEKMNNQCAEYDETLIKLRDAHDTEKQSIKKLKKQIAGLREVLKEETG